MSKRTKIFFVAAILAISLFFAYCTLAATVFISDEYTVVEGGNINYSLPYFISQNRQYTQSAASSGALKDEKITDSGYEKQVTLKLFDILPVRTVSVNVVKNPQIIPSGECIGVKMKSRGLLTVGVSDFETQDGKSVSPAKDAKIRPGDIITEINGKRIKKTAELTEELDLKEGENSLKIIRGGGEITVSLTPQKAKDGHNRLGIWVRDSIAGIGTMTFVNADDGSFAALGHGISDSDANVLVPLDSATLFKAKILGINKGKKGVPGEIIGAIKEDEAIGTCSQNLAEGIYGKIDTEISKNSVTQIAPGSEVKKGEAAIICSLDESGPKAYSLEILNINRLGKGGTKSMIIEVTDRRLIEKTGGIVQGMSGSPIIQNGKLIGAVTHVFVNNPLRGYGIFAETMLGNVN